MSFKNARSRLVPAALAGLLAANTGSVHALEFDIGGTRVQVDTLFTIGATFRMQDIDNSLIGKSTLTPGLCLIRTNGPADRPLPRGENQFGEGQILRNCTTSSPLGSPSSDVISPENLQYVAAPGSYSFANDDGNLQFEKYDPVHAVAKVSSDIGFSLYDFNFFIRPTVFFDQVYQDHEIRWPDTATRAAVSEYPDNRMDINGFTGIDILDANVGRSFDLFDRSIAFKLGKQVLNWGESSLLLFNSLNSINPPDARRLRLPGLDLKEVLQPVNMITINADIVDNVGLELFYAFEWRGLVVDPVGSFQSPADILGAGGDYAMLGFGKPPEDPNGLFRAIDTCTEVIPGVLEAPCVDSLGLLGSASSRTARVSRSTPSDSGQFGFAVKTFLEDFNNGTELSFYFANYHSRFPIVSLFAASQATCLDPMLGAASLVTSCGFSTPGRDADNPATPENDEPVPVDTIRFLVEYPEDVQMYGVSFNTTIGDWALSGEYAFRPNLPVQVHTTDLGYAAFQPAFPAQDIQIPLPGLPALVTVPGRQSAFPSFVTRYRGLTCESDETCYQPGQYIPGFEEMKSGQLNITFVKIIGGDNPLGASQITFLLETGLTHTLDFPELSELQFNGGGTNTHISSGADGSQGVDPPGVAGNSNGNQRRNNGLMQNPTAHRDHDGFGSEYAYGYRNINILRWDDALFGANLQGLAIIRHDVNGTSPGIGTNFTDGRKEFNLGLSFDYLSSWIGEVRYTWFTGGAERDVSRDKDNIFITAGYQF